MRLKLANFMSAGERVHRRLHEMLPNTRVANERNLLQSLARGVSRSLAFNQEEFRGRVFAFMESMQVGPAQYRYAGSRIRPTLYCSAYAFLTRHLLGGDDPVAPNERAHWLDFFDAFQSPDDGLFRDPVISGSRFENGDSWGARHLALHIMPVYAALGRTPKYRFAYLDDFKDTGLLQRWLDSQDWSTLAKHQNDIDNKLMNVVCALQYERDFRGDLDAGNAVDLCIRYLDGKCDPETGLWGNPALDDADQLSRAMQFAYHLYSIHFYDRRRVTAANKLIDLTLETQNVFGGFGVAPNSSACEDIDSIDLLTQLSARTNWRRHDIQHSIERAFIWLLANQNDDGGFVFRRNEPFFYGHRTMASAKNESAMFPTWFRTLAIARAASFLGKGNFRYIRCPGLQFAVEEP